ncbi:alpha/beta fold hydrolase [Streptomyces sp. NPDC093546]|uniref:alpha/beta fold hydrolase n=1 Tax=Streptomyces sp. NPDC093546 TaxID=3366040 RepID=UPI003815C395
MRPRVIYVHGNGNKVRAELLKSQWDQALFGRDMGEVSRMAYWAPLRYDTPLPDSEPDPLDGAPEAFEEMPGPTAVEAPEEFVARTLGESWFESGGAAPEGPWTGEAGDPLGRWLRDMTYLADTMAETEPRRGSGLDEAFPLPAPVRKAVFRILVKHTFKDVHAYFFGGAGPAIRDVLRTELDAVGDAPLLVVGHSLGSIVAYEVLAETRREVELFVTVGSPLAVKEVQDHLAAPPAVPAGVRAWRNASDLRDLVALDHTLRPEYAPPELITDLLVVNDSPNHHRIAPYLSDAQVRNACQEVLDRLAGA